MNTIKNNIWVQEQLDVSLIKRLSESYDVSYLEAVFLHNRIEDAHQFLNYKISDYIKSTQLIDMHKTIARIKLAIEKKEKVAIFGDYDVDGITSTAMFIKLFQAYGIEHVYRIPNREDGYGHDAKSVRSVNASLVIMLDCGSSAGSEFSKIGKDICIIDHHQTSKNPDVFSFANPHRKDVDPRTQENFLDLCTAGLCFIVIFHLMNELKHISVKFDFKNLLDLVALGTIGDCMKLTHLNRAYVQYGLKLISLQNGLGIKFLCESLRLEKITASQAAFYICPCINAAGRVGSSDIALKLLCTNNIEDAYKLSKTLIGLNERRKMLEQKSLEEILPNIQESNCIIEANADWHPGIVGILAGRIKEKFNRPSFVLYKKGIFWKGSARSITGVNIGVSIHEAILAGFAESGGGHAMAGGVTVHEDKYLDWKAFMQKNIKVTISKPTLKIDCSMTLKSVFSSNVAKVSPFGTGNLSPYVLVQKIWLENAVIYKEHVRLTLNENGFKCNVFAFRWFDFFNLLPIRNFVDIVVSVNEDNKVFIVDMRKSSE